MKRVLLATRNEGKLRELRHLLGGLGLRLESLASHPDVADVDESGDSFDANARLKASAAAKATGLWSVGEDSGLVVDALGGAPGVRSARYSGVHGDDAANTAKLLRELGARQERGARFVCVIALAMPNGEIACTALGTCEGRVAAAPRGSNGFGYDPIFEPERVPDRTMAELGAPEKALLSHRGQALRAFIPLLRVHLATEGEPATDP